MRWQLPVFIVFLIALAIMAAAQTPASSAVVSGRIMRAGGTDPISRATVSLSAVEPSRNRNQTTVTGNDGTFSFNNIAPGQYRIAVDRYGYIKQEYGQRSYYGMGMVITVGAGQRIENLDFRLSPAGAISGRIFSADGEPVANVYVEALSYQYRDGTRTLVAAGGLPRTNDLGEYRAFWLPPGEYFISTPPLPSTHRQLPSTEDQSYIRLYFPGEIDLERAVPITLAPSAEVRGIDFVLRPVSAVKVRGRVVAPDPAYSQITLVRAGVEIDANRLANRSNVAPNGSFEFNNVIPGSYMLIARLYHEGRYFTASTPVDVADTAVEGIVLTLRPSIEVPGQIFFDGQTPALLEMEQLRVTLTFSDARVGLTPSTIATATARVNPDGSFVLPNVATTGYRVSLAGLPAGAYLLAGRYGAADALNGPVQISDENIPLQLQIGFTPGRLDGTATDAGGQAFVGALCALVPAARNRSELYRTATTDQYGKFSFADVVPGDYKIFAWEDIPPGAHQDAAYLGRFEPLGQAIRVDKSGFATLQVRVIPLN